MYYADCWQTFPIPALLHRRVVLKSQGCRRNRFQFIFLLVLECLGISSSSLGIGVKITTAHFSNEKLTTQEGRTTLLRSGQWSAAPYRRVISRVNKERVENPSRTFVCRYARPHPSESETPHPEGHFFRKKSFSDSC